MAGALSRDQRTKSISQYHTSNYSRSLPHSKEAEAAILGSVLIDSNIFSKLSEELLAEDFFVSNHKAIFEAMSTIHSQGKQVELVVLQDELDKKIGIDQVGGVAFLLSLQEDLTIISFVDQHIKILKDKSLLRRIILSASEIVNKCYGQDEGDVYSVVDDAEKVLFEIGSQRNKKSFVQLDFWLKNTFKFLVDVQSSHKGVTGVPSGYAKLDDMTGGFQPGDFIVLAARPSMGKTALAMCLAKNAALNDKVIGIISLEMSAEQLSLRLLAMEAHVNLSSIRTGMMSSDDWLRLTNAAADLSAHKIFIDDIPMQSVMDIRTKARKLKLESKVDIIIVDYLQLLHSAKRHENRHQEVSEISRFLKALAKELNIPIIALSQLSRTVDSRSDKRPMLSDLRDSGAIEQDADLILFLYRDVAYHADTPDPNLAELIIGKQRNGPTGTINLNYVREYTLFEDMA